MRNLVKEYIESGKTFKDLENEFAISASEFGNLICLNYSQIDSPKTADIVRQSRGIILDKNTLEIVHYPFFRFYNLDEVLEERTKFNWNNAFGLEKIDGSLFAVTWYKDNWVIATRGQIGGFNKVSIGMFTFGDIFDQAVGGNRDEFFAHLDKNIDYTFELVSPMNKIVTPYAEPALYLIGARDKSNDFQEINIKTLKSSLPEYIKFPKEFKLIDSNGNFIGFEQMKMKANGLERPTDEGFVVVDYTSYNSEFGYFPRMKVKNSSYVALHHMRGTFENGALNYGGILEIIRKGEKDEVLANFKEFEPFFDEVETKWTRFTQAINVAIESVEDFWKIIPEERLLPQNKKNFALSIDKRFQTFLFIMFNKNFTWDETLEYLAATNKNYNKKLWEDFVSKF
jgi:hypothetical protein